MKPSKKGFYNYMSGLYGRYRKKSGYETLLSIIDRADDTETMLELMEMPEYNTKQRLQYRYVMACMGKELTPREIDEYFSIIEYAFLYIGDI